MSEDNNEGGERIVRRCDCSACRRELRGRVHSTANGAGAYCSHRCADHAGLPRYIAEAEHQGDA